MRKLIMMGMALAVSAAMLMTSCNNEKASNNGTNNTENSAKVLPNAVTDIDGNNYNAVQIGDQVWMAENLRTTHYADGTEISTENVFSDKEPHCYAPDGKIENVPSYGYLYNWQAVMHGAACSGSMPSGVQGICPDGWHMPSDTEWTVLENTLKNCGYENCKANVLMNAEGWISDTVKSKENAADLNPGMKNATGFSALPAGYYSEKGYAGFGGLSVLWSASGNDSTSCFRMLVDEVTYINKSFTPKANALSVRCVRD